MLRIVKTVASVTAALACVMAAPATGATQDLEAYLGQHGYSRVALSKLTSGHETLRVTINGVEGVFVLDSGAGASVVDNASLVKFALAPSTDQAEMATGAGGEIAVVRYPVQSLSVGDVALDLAEVRGMDLSGVVNALKSATGAEIDGVIGQDVLTRFSGVIDVRAQALFLRKPTPPETN